jgi:hypothetical protein
MPFREIAKTHFLFNPIAVGSVLLWRGQDFSDRQENGMQEERW